MKPATLTISPADKLRILYTFKAVSPATMEMLRKESRKLGQGMDAYLYRLVRLSQKHGY